MRKLLPIAIAVASVAAMCGFVFFMSARPAAESGAMSMEVVRKIINFVVPGFGDLPSADQLHWLDRLDHIVRKIAHFSEFALLGVLILNLVLQFAKPAGIQALTAKRAGLAWALATAYAATDEVHQVFVPGRSCLPTDVCIDSAGALVGIFIFAAISALVMRVRG